MYMEMLLVRFPDLAEKETRCIILQKGNPLPPGEYFLAESFCNDKTCDCRRAFINIIHDNDSIATIGYGWEDLKFYEKWIGDKKVAPSVKGPILEMGGVRTKYSDAALALFKEVALSDATFISRLPKHYEKFKKSL